jgi:hypothetical protein
VELLFNYRGTQNIRNTGGVVHGVWTRYYRAGKLRQQLMAKVRHKHPGPTTSPNEVTEVAPNGWTGLE